MIRFIPGGGFGSRPETEFEMATGMIGPQAWRWFSTDTANVPSMGIYGDVKRFEDKAAKYGLYVAWSGIHECFCIYSLTGRGEPVCQDICHDMSTYEPRPLTDEYLSFIVAVWEQFARTSKATIMAHIAAAKQQKTEQKRRERQEWMNLTRKDAREGYERKMGKTPKIFSYPGA